MTVCRTCLQEGQKVKDLFSRNHNPRLDMMLMSSTQLEASPLDGLPRVICISCSDKLYMAYMFKKMCHESETILKKHSLNNISEEQIQIPEDVQDGCNDNSIVTNDFTTESVTDIPALIKLETLHTASDLNVENIENNFENEENHANVVENNEIPSPNDVNTDVTKRTSRKKKKYDCSKCSGKFNNVIQYQNHYCDKVRFTCTKCNKNYTSEVKLERHIKKVHEKELIDSSADVTDLTSLVSGLLEVKYLVDANQILDIKEEIVEDNDNDNDSIREDNDEASDDITYDTGMDDEASDVEWKKEKPPKKVIPKRWPRKKIQKDPQKNPIKKPKTERLPCEHCTRSFRTPTCLANHAAREHGVGKKMFGCGKCHKMFRTKYLCKQHRDKDHVDISKPFICHHCGKNFPFRYGVVKHLGQAHNPNKKRFGCSTRYCEERFDTKEELVKHRLGGVHTGSMDYTKLTCDYCNREFKRKYALRRHILNAHMEPLPNCVECNECKRTFNTKYAMRIHAKIHSTDKLNSNLCPECGRGFSTSQALRNHLARHRGDKKHKCQYCEKAFVRYSDRVVHEKHHTDTKAHLCTLCGKGFVRPCALKVHMRSHTGEKPYKCTYCDWRCSQPSDLKAHIRRHTGERFVCDVCSKDFLQGYMLKNHKLSAHGIYDPKNNSRVKKVSLPAVSSEVIQIVKTG